MNANEILRGPDRCLESGELEAYLEGRLPEAAGHVDSCPACAHEVHTLREFLAAEVRPEESGDLAWVESRLKSAPAKDRSSWLGPSVIARWAFGLAAVLLVVAGGVQLRRMAGSGLRTSTDLATDAGGRVVRSTQIRLIAPLGDLDAAPALLQWSPVDKAASYSVQITEVDGAVFWNGTSIQANLSIPFNIISLIAPRKTLLWHVRALNARGEIMAESNSERFSVLPSKTH